MSRVHRTETASVENKQVDLEDTSTKWSVPEDKSEWSFLPICYKR